jgi:WXXGXW repeat (2 copies)
MPINNHPPSLGKRCSRAAFRIALGACLSLMLIALLAAPTPLYGQIAVGVSVSIAPPPLPVYTQPICPGAGYLWTPGYWGWDPVDGYYWVPGTWVEAPFAGALWTPGYWGWSGGAFLWNAGYWGPEIGFYGGINYGFGYVGVGYLGGYWTNGVFNYNRTVNNVSTTNITNVYSKTVINNYSGSHVSYNGGAGGIAARPTSAQLAAASARRDPAVAAQVQQAAAARRNPAQFVTANHGRPAVAATARPGAFSGSGVVRASRAGGSVRVADYAPAVNRNAGRSTTVRPTERAAVPAGRAVEGRPASSGTRAPVIRSSRVAPPSPSRLVSRPSAPAVARRSSRTSVSPARQGPAARSAERGRSGSSTPQRKTSYSPRPSATSRTRPLNNTRRNTMKAPRAKVNAPAARAPKPAKTAPVRRAPQPAAGRPAPHAASRPAPRAASRPAPRAAAAPRATAPAAPEREARPQAAPKEKNRPPR